MQHRKTFGWLHFSKHQKHALIVQIYSILKHPCHSKSCQAYWGQRAAPPSVCGSCQPCIPRKQWGAPDGWYHLWATSAPGPYAFCYACGTRSPCVRGEVRGTCDVTGRGQKKKYIFMNNSTYNALLWFWLNLQMFYFLKTQTRLFKVKIMSFIYRDCFLSRPWLYRSCLGFHYDLRVVPSCPTSTTNPNQKHKGQHYDCLTHTKK